MIRTVGGEIDAWCTSCRMNLNHRIVAIVRSTPKRVECLTCNKQHNYRAPRGLEEILAEKQGPSQDRRRRASARGAHDRRPTRLASGRG